MGAFIDMTGKRYSKMVVICQGPDSRRGKRWLCRCDCGTEKICCGIDLRIGHTTSCGCSKVARAIAMGREKGVHRQSYTPLGSSWQVMMTRCYNKNNHTYERYGGAGRYVCEFLRASPLNLALLIGDRPPDKSIDRINTNGSYTCGQCAECLKATAPMNVRWATDIEQGRNMPSFRLIEIAGVSKRAFEWEELSGIPAKKILERYHRGWTGERLLSPVIQRIHEITIGGVTKRQADWARESGVSEAAIAARLRAGETGETLLRPSRRAQKQIPDALP